MAVALYMDQHVPRAIAAGLRLRGVDVLTAYEDGASTRKTRRCLIGLASYGGSCSPRMMICWLKRPGVRRKASRLPASSTPTNSMFLSERASATWKLSPRAVKRRN